MRFNRKRTGELYRVLIGHNFMLQLENHLKYELKVVKVYLQEMVEGELLEVINWLSQRPNLNIIEHEQQLTSPEKGF